MFLFSVASKKMCGRSQQQQQQAEALVDDTLPALIKERDTASDTIELLTREIADLETGIKAVIRTDPAKARRLHQTKKNKQIRKALAEGQYNQLFAAVNAIEQQKDMKEQVQAIQMANHSLRATRPEQLVTQAQTVKDELDDHLVAAKEVSEKLSEALTTTSGDASMTDEDEMAAYLAEAQAEELQQQPQSNAQPQPPPVEYPSVASLPLPTATYAPPPSQKRMGAAPRSPVAVGAAGGAETQVRQVPAPVPVPVAKVVRVQPAGTPPPRANPVSRPQQPPPQQQQQQQEEDPLDRLLTKGD